MVGSKIGKEHAPVARTREFLHMILNVPGDQGKRAMKHPEFLPRSQGEGSGCIGELGAHIRASLRSTDSESLKTNGGEENHRSHEHAVDPDFPTRSQGEGSGRLSGSKERSESQPQHPTMLPRREGRGWGVGDGCGGRNKQAVFTAVNPA
jgi:hypothetical protein